MLFRSSSSLEFVGISLGVVIPVVLCTAAFFIFAVGMGIRAQRLKPTTGTEGIVGEVGETITKLNPEGQVRVHGEIWKAVSVEGAVSLGAKVKVERVDNLKLIVRLLT